MKKSKKLTLTEGEVKDKLEGIKKVDTFTEDPNEKPLMTDDIIEKSLRENHKPVEETKPLEKKKDPLTEFKAGIKAKIDKAIADNDKARVEKEAELSEENKADLERQKAEYDKKIAEMDRESEEKSDADNVKTDPPVSDTEAIETRSKPTVSEDKGQDKGQKEDKKGFWSKFFKGDKELRRKFETANPNLFSAVFTNSGLSMGERARALGEILTTLGYGYASGVKSGIEGTALPPALKGPLAEAYAEANRKTYERQQSMEDAANLPKVVQSEIDATVDANPLLADLDDNTKKVIKSTIGAGHVYSYADMLDKTDGNFTLDEYNAYLAAAEGSERISRQRGVALENMGKELANARTDLETRKEQYSVISSLYTLRAELSSKLKGIENLTPTTDIMSLLGDVKSALGGLVTYTNAQTDENGNNTTNQWGANGSLGRKGIGEVSVNGGSTYAEAQKNAQQLGLNFDTVYNEMQKVREENKDLFASNLKNYKEQIKPIINDAIGFTQLCINNELSKMKLYNANASQAVATDATPPKQADDIAIPADGKQRYIVDEDGNTTELNKKDTVIATKSLDDIRAMLGYDGHALNKDFNYYISLLRRF